MAARSFGRLFLRAPQLLELTDETFAGVQPESLAHFLTALLKPPMHKRLLPEQRAAHYIHWDREPHIKLRFLLDVGRSIAGYVAGHAANDLGTALDAAPMSQRLVRPAAAPAASSHSVPANA